MISFKAGGMAGVSGRSKLLVKLRDGDTTNMRFFGMGEGWRGVGGGLLVAGYWWRVTGGGTFENDEPSGGMFSVFLTQRSRRRNAAQRAQRIRAKPKTTLELPSYFL